MSETRNNILLGLQYKIFSAPAPARSFLQNKMLKKLHGRLHWIYFYLFLDKIITGNNENNGGYFVETLYNLRCTATTELHLIIEVKLYPALSLFIKRSLCSV